MSSSRSSGSRRFRRLALCTLAGVVLALVSCQREDVAWAPVACPSALAAPTLEQTREWDAAAQARLRNDWADLECYREANRQLGGPAAGARRVVFIGNSITDAWARYFPAHFPGKPYIGRGISGHTSPQLLVRFQQDVVSLSPAVVVIMAGTNDIGGNTGPSTLSMVEDNIRSMTEIAQANGIRVVLCSVLPASAFRWRPGFEPAAKIVALNARLRDYARRAGIVYVDYHSAMADSRQGLPAHLAADGVHPTEAGYRVMVPLVEAAIAEALEGGR